MLNWLPSTISLVLFSILLSGWYNILLCWVISFVLILFTENTGKLLNWLHNLIQLVSAKELFAHWWYWWTGEAGRAERQWIPPRWQAEKGWQITHDLCRLLLFVGYKLLMVWNFIDGKQGVYDSWKVMQFNVEICWAWKVMKTDLGDGKSWKLLAFV